jgi:hypothetical protein
MRGLEPLTSCMQKHKFYPHPRKLDFLKSHCYIICVMLPMGKAFEMVKKILCSSLLRFKEDPHNDKPRAKQSATSSPQG